MTLKKSLKRFFTEYIPDLDLLYHKRNPFITTIVDSSLFEYLIS